MDTFETALYYAGLARDVSSLKALARQERERADKTQRLLVSVLHALGPVEIPHPKPGDDNKFSVVFGDKTCTLGAGHTNPIGLFALHKQQEVDEGKR